MSEWEARWFAWVLVIATFVVFVVSSSVAGSPESFKTVGVRVPAQAEASQEAVKASEAQAPEGFWLAQLALRRVDAREEGEGGASDDTRNVAPDTPRAVGTANSRGAQPPTSLPHPWQPADECA